MTITAFDVTGMTCRHCEHAIMQEVSQIAGVTEVQVTAATGRLVVISSTELVDAEVIAAVDEAGYTAVRAGAGVADRMAS